jgi:hypothetical protein
LPSQIDSSDIARLLQAHLKRVGCNLGTVDGNWDDGSKKALELFNKNAQTHFDVKLASLGALDAVRGKSDRVCPLVCGKGQKVDGDRCVQIGCRVGYSLNLNGECEKKPAAAPVAQSAIKREQSAISPANRNGSRCFTFSGKSYCE